MGNQRSSSSPAVRLLWWRVRHLVRLVRSSAQSRFDLLRLAGPRRQTLPRQRRTLFFRSKARNSIIPSSITLAPAAEDATSSSSSACVYIGSKCLSIRHAPVTADTQPATNERAANRLVAPIEMCTFECSCIAHSGGATLSLKLFIYLFIFTWKQIVIPTHYIPNIHKPLEDMIRHFLIFKIIQLMQQRGVWHKKYVCVWYFFLFGTFLDSFIYRFVR